MALIDELQNLSDLKGAGDSAASATRGTMLKMKGEIMQELESIIEQRVKEKVDSLNLRDGYDGKDGKDALDGADGSPDTPKEIKDKLETLKDEKRLDASAIKNLPRLIESISNNGGGKGGGGSTMRVANLSSQCNGSTRTFTTTYRIGEAHALFYSAFPHVILPTTDYTASGKTITLNNAMNPPVAGQSLLLIHESAD